MRLQELGLTALVALAWVVARPEPTSATPPSAPATAAHVGAPEVAMLVGDPLGTSSLLYFVDMDDVDATRGGDARLGKPVATLDHREGAALSAVTGPSGDVFAIADVGGDKDLSFDGSLFRLRAGEPTRTIADRVIHASRAVVTIDGDVLVARGEPGATPPVGATREDVLWVDEIDPDTGTARTLLSADGYLLYVIGATPSEVFVYRVTSAGADIVAVDRKTKHERAVVSSVPDFARDFSLDPEGRTLTFVDLATKPSENAPAEWSVLRVDLASGAMTELTRSSSMALVPFALPHADVLVTTDPSRGSERLFGARVSLGSGTAHVAALSTDQHFATGVTNLPGLLGRPFVLDLDGDVTRFVDVPTGARVTVAGFVSAGAAKTGLQ